MPAGECAFHFEQGCQHDKALTAKAISYLLQAGDQENRLYAHQDAVDHYRRALFLLKESGDFDGSVRALMRLGLAYHTAFDFRRSRQAYEEGFALWQQAAETQSAVPSPEAPHPLRVALDPPETLDPTMSYYTASGILIRQLFNGLVELSPELEIVPNVAQRWEVSDGGQKYIFHLRNDVRWSDGVPLTAADFEYAWKRVLDPEIGAFSATHLYDIKGAVAYHQGKVNDPDSIGVWARDDSTLVVELERPTSYFLHLLNYEITVPVPQHVVEVHGRAWTKPDHIVTNGPFRLEARQGEECLILSRNPFYHGRQKGNVKSVNISLNPDIGNSLERYETNELDILDLKSVSTPEMDNARMRHIGEYLTGPLLETYYVGFNVNRPPFDDPRIRRAFVLAIDREKLANITMRGLFSPGTGGFIPPGMPGHSPEAGLPFDPEQAQKLLAEAGYANGNGFPAITMLARSKHGTLSEYLRQQWSDRLAIDIDRQTINDSRNYWDRLSQDPPPIFFAKWAADYSDPDNFLRVSPIRIYTRWQNQSYDRLVEEARRTTDQTERLGLYARTDKILVEEAAIMPVFYSRAHLLVKPWVRKYPISAMEYWFWKDAIIEPHD
jgi:oligopeptide transport system substrate-binding protein